MSVLGRCGVGACESSNLNFHFLCERRSQAAEHKGGGGGIKGLKEIVKA